MSEAGRSPRLTPEDAAAAAIGEGCVVFAESEAAQDLEPADLARATQLFEALLFHRAGRGGQPPRTF